MPCIADIASCSPFSPGTLQLRKLAAGGETSDPAYACFAVIHSGIRMLLLKKC